MPVPKKRKLLPTGDGDDDATATTDPADLEEINCNFCEYKTNSKSKINICQENSIFKIFNH